MKYYNEVVLPALRDEAKAAQNQRGVNLQEWMSSGTEQERRWKKRRYGRCGWSSVPKELHVAATPYEQMQQQAFRAGAYFGAGFIPYVGEAVDVAILFAPFSDVTALDRFAAGGAAHPTSVEGCRHHGQAAADLGPDPL